MRLHIDTDLGDNPDDDCALVMALGWPGVELTGVTTTADPDGRRAAQVERLLAWVGAAVPVGSSDAATDLLADSIRSGATLAAIGPYTNLARLEQTHPGALAGVPVFTMGGWVDAFGVGYPRWGPERDHNVQSDTDAAMIVLGSGAALTLVPCASAVTASLRTTDLPRLVSSGTVGARLARLSMAHGEAHGYPALGRRHAALPDDLVSFLWDPVTCAAAVGWDGAVVSEIRLQPVLEDGVLRFARHPDGRRTRVVTEIDGTAFTETWLAAVEDAQTAP